jgi:hypothetical protein
VTGYKSSFLVYSAAAQWRLTLDSGVMPFKSGEEMQPGTMARTRFETEEIALVRQIKGF